MKTSKYGKKQIVGFLKQAGVGMPIKVIGRKHGFSDAGFYKWRSKYGGMDATEAKRLRDSTLGLTGLVNALGLKHPICRFEIF